MLKRVVAVGVSSLAVIAGGASAVALAGGGNKPVEQSEVNVEFQSSFPSGEYQGTVNSTARCERYRLVIVLERGGGRSPSERGGDGGGSEPPVRIGEDRTNRRGEFRVKPSLAPDFSAEYFARVKQERRRKVICARDVSEPEAYQVNGTTTIAN